MQNAYPELAVIPYRRTTVTMPDVIDAIRAMPEMVEIQRAAYIVFRNESANGQSGVNNNYAGVQADSGRWPENLTHWFEGTVVLPENQTGLRRRFVSFRTPADCLAFLCDRIGARGLYIGGRTHLIANMVIATPTDLARAYFKEWVRGDAAAEPDKATLDGFLSMYAQAQSFFN